LFPNSAIAVPPKAEPHELTKHPWHRASGDVDTGPETPTRRQELRPARIAVVGGGFSGAMSAVNIARLTAQPLHIVVINDGPSAGRGVAYGLRRPEYLLNVAVRNMSAFPHEPDHFLQWLRTRSEFELTPEIELRERFIPRQIYGDYLRSIVQHHLQSTSTKSPSVPRRHHVFGLRRTG
jgi:uncharacterized NAD(P)/FAD-binding protein YdhS